MTAMNRRDIILKFADLMEKNIAALAELTRITHGGPIATFNKWETAQSCETFRYYATWIDKFSGESFPQDDGYMKVVRNEPLGKFVSQCRFVYSNFFWITTHSPPSFNLLDISVLISLFSN